MWRERAVLVRSASLLPVLAGPMVLWLLTALRDAPGETHWMTPQEKLLQLASPFINYLLPLDLISAALVFGAVAAGRRHLLDRTCAARHRGRRSACDPVRGAPVRSDGHQLPGYPHRHHVGISPVRRCRSGAPAATGPAGGRHRADRAVCGAHGSCGGGLDGTSARPRRSPDRHRGGTTRGLGRHDQRAAGGGARVLERGTAQQADLERSAHRISPASAADHRAGCILAAAVRQSRTTADPPAARLCQAGPRGVTTFPPMPRWWRTRTVDALRCATSISS